MNQNFSFNILLFLNSCQFHPILPKPVLPPLFDICDSLHGLDGLNVEVSVILQRLVSFFLELEDGIIGKFFVIEFAGSFGPGKLSGVMFGFEVTVAFGSAETEVFAVVSNEHNTVAWVDWPWAEVASFYSHQQSL